MQAVCRRRRHCCCNFLSARSPSFRPPFTAIHTSNQITRPLHISCSSLAPLFARLYAYLVPAAAASAALISPRNSALSPICQRARSRRTRQERGPGGRLLGPRIEKESGEEASGGRAASKAKRGGLVPYMLKSSSSRRRYMRHPASRVPISIPSQQAGEHGVFSHVQILDAR